MHEKAVAKVVHVFLTDAAKRLKRLANELVGDEVCYRECGKFGILIVPDAGDLIEQVINIVRVLWVSVDEAGRRELSLVRLGT